MKYLIFSFLVICVACKPEVQEKASELTETKTVREAQDQFPDVPTYEALRAHPWEVEVVLNNGRIENESEWKGSEITFLEDGQYNWVKGTSREAGKFSMDESNNIIHLQAKDVSLNTEWSIKYRESIMVWIGTPKYSLQAIQIKLVRPRTLK